MVVVMVCTNYLTAHHTTTATCTHVAVPCIVLYLAVQCQAIHTIPLSRYTALAQERVKVKQGCTHRSNYKCGDLFRIK